ncbi:MAG: outer membrane protein assembly factor BamD, partial [Candidatus Saccharibacteria bacterium]|nr:outer membrane protein assembly factor BamD [Rhodoferax sp.]
MLRIKLSAVYAWLFMITALVVSGCSSTPVDKTVGLTPAKIYAEAKDEMSNGQWERSIPLLEKLEARAAGTPLAQQAQLDKAYAQYKASETEQALATIERFKKLHPVSPAMDYALYLQGLVTFNDDMGLFSGIT